MTRVVPGWSRGAEALGGPRPVPSEAEPGWRRVWCCSAHLDDIEPVTHVFPRHQRRVPVALVRHVAAARHRVNRNWRATGTERMMLSNCFTSYFATCFTGFNGRPRPHPAVGF